MGLFEKMKSEVKGDGFPYFNQKRGLFIFNTLKDMDEREEIIDIYRKKGIESFRLNSYEEILKIEPFYAKARIKPAGGFVFPLDSCINTYDFACRMHNKAVEMGVRSSVNCEFKNFIFKDNTKEIQGV